MVSWFGQLKRDPLQDFHHIASRQTIHVPKLGLGRSRNERYLLLQTSYVQVEAWCTGPDCRATKIWKSLKPHPPPSWSAVDSTGRAFSDFARGLTGSILGHEADPTPIQGTFVDPSQPFSNIGSQPHTPQALQQLSKDSFALSVAQIMNTYWIVAIATPAVPAGLVQPELNATLQAQEASALPASNVSTVEPHEVFVCNKAWLAVLLLVDLILFLFGITGTILALFNKGPSLTLNMSSMVRDSPYVATQPPRSLCSKGSRSRALRDIRIRYGDVAPREAIGRIGIGECNGRARLQVGKLDRTRDFL